MDDTVSSYQTSRRIYELILSMQHLFERRGGVLLPGRQDVTIRISTPAAM